MLVNSLHQVILCTNNLVRNLLAVAAFVLTDSSSVNHSLPRNSIIINQVFFRQKNLLVVLSVLPTAQVRFREVVAPTPLQVLWTRRCAYGDNGG